MNEDGRTGTHETLVDKVTVTGPPGAGKTTLIHRFVYRVRYDQHPGFGDPRSIGPPFHTREVVHEGTPVTIQLWEDDSWSRRAGGVVRKINFLGARGVLACYDVSDARAFPRLPTLLEELHHLMSTIKREHPAVPAYRVVLVGCKADLPRAVPVEAADRLAAAHGCSGHFQCSVREIASIDALFAHVAAWCAENLERASGESQPT